MTTNKKYFLLVISILGIYYTSPIIGTSSRQSLRPTLEKKTSEMTETTDSIMAENLAAKKEELSAEIRRLSEEVKILSMRIKKLESDVARLGH